MKCDKCDRTGGFHKCFRLDCLNMGEAQVHDIIPNRPLRTDYYYLACPHSHDDPKVQQLRYESAVQCQANLTRAGMSVFNPIAMSHHADLVADGAITHAMWLRCDYPFLYHACGLFILQLPGWEISDGVAWETNTMIDFNRPIFFIPPDEYLHHWPIKVLNSFYGGVNMNTENKGET